MDHGCLQSSSRQDGPVGARPSSSPSTPVPIGSVSTAGCSSRRRNSFSDGSSGSITASTRLSEEVSSAGLEANHSKSAHVHSEIKAIANNDSGDIKRGEVTGPVQREFEMDPAHKFWKWNTETQNWFHKDECTGFVLWAPKQLD
ncbi:hypothetical protein K456DRAFT_48460 [Colletotrichum gloeosporioides 23]|nr:hypothetical protein K456DRAFT_48460 [Colletotrichum gloeosporioides 23]